VLPLGEIGSNASTFPSSPVFTTPCDWAALISDARQLTLGPPELWNVSAGGRAELPDHFGGDGDRIRVPWCLNGGEQVHARLFGMGKAAGADNQMDGRGFKKIHVQVESDSARSDPEYE
jgi:hypothetical protein